MKTAHRNAAHAKRAHRSVDNPVALALSSASAFTPAQREMLAKGPRVAIEALQFGKFDDFYWRELADALNVAEQMAKPPVNLANDHAEKFEEAQCVLYALSEQYRDRKSWTPRAAQLQALKDALEIYEIQLAYVGQGEFERSVQKVINCSREALHGSGNCVVVEALS